MNSLTYEDYKLLLLLQNEPTITYAKIAEELGVSAPTAKRRVEKLKEKKIYRGKRVLYRPESLGLTRYLFILYVYDVSSLEKLEAALKYHPYIISRSRIYGTRLGIIAQFNYPSKDPSLLLELFNRLKERGIIQSVIPFQSTGIRKTLQMDLERLSLSTLKWSYDWDSCLEKLSKIEPKPLPEPSSPVLSSMKPVDFKILEILTRGKIPSKNGKRFDTEITQVKLSEYLNIETTEIWRRYHFLEDHVLSRYTSIFSREYFNISSEKIIIMSFPTEEQLYKCYILFTDEKEGPPFRYHIEIYKNQRDKKHLILYVSLPQYHEAQLIYTLSRIAKLRVFNVDTIGRSSVSYYFYPEAVDTEKKQWKTDTDFVLETPLKEILEELKHYN
ncbi:MAG: AsnC family transcriptional regulator [Candidatus Heimdallarchaeaceae archaeon]